MLLRDILKDVKDSQYRKVITKDKLSSKTRDRNLVDINQERRGLEDKYEQALRDGDKGLAKSYSDRLEELRKEAIEAENKRDEERKNFGDAQASAVEPTNPSHIAAAKRESVAKGVAATTGKTTSDKKSKVKDKLSRLKKTLDKINDILTQDPLTGKGEKILSNMKEQYGEKKGEQVFYASKNKGTISGVDKKTKDADDVFVHHVEGAYKVYADGRLVGTYQSESEAENRADEFRNKTKDAKSDIDREWSADEDVMKQKVRDGNSYNMAVEHELFTYYNIPRSQARRIVERNSQELQKKEDANITVHNAADMLIHKEGLKGFEKIYVTQGDSKTKDGEYSVKDAVTKTPPDKCDYCGGAIGDDFYDAKLDGGSWGDVCKRCFRMHGEGLGTGRGQHYRKTSSGVFEKTNDKKTKDQNISEEIIKILVEKGVDRKQADAILMKNWDKIISQISQGFLVPDIAQALFFKGTKDANPDMVQMYQQKLEDAIDSGDKEEMKRWGRELLSEVMGTSDKKTKDADEDVCKECKKNYDPDKADARDPDSFCSSKCETAHKANEAQYRHDTTKDNYAEELKKMRDQLEKAKEEGDEDKARDLEIEIADFIKETADKKTKDSKTRDNLYAELRDAKRDISRIDNLVSNDTVTKMYGGGGIIQQEIDNEMKKREELKQKVKELEQKIADLKKQGIDPYYV